MAAAVALCALLVAAAPAPVRAASDAQIAEATQRAVTWLRARQQPDGSLGPNGGLDPAWALIGLAGAGVHAADLRAAPVAPSAQDYYRGLWAAGDDSAWAALGGVQASDFERAILIAGAIGVQPTRVAVGQNLLAKLAGYYRDGFFASKTTVFNQTIFGLLALDQVPVAPALRERTAAIVEAAQHDDGGYSAAPTGPGARSDVDMTGAAIAALCGAGRTLADPSVAGAVAFLRAGTGEATSSAAWALDGLGACGIRRGSASWTGGDEAAVDALLARQEVSGPDAGSWLYGFQPNMYSTQDGLRALTVAGFATPPPARANPADPVVLPAPAVSPGTEVPAVLVVDPGDGAPRLCATTAPAGATVATVLARASVASAPPGCVAEVEEAGGHVVAIDGAAAGPGETWLARVDDGPEAAAGPQAVGFGEVVNLRLPRPLALDPPRLVIPPAPVGEAAASRTLTATNVSDRAVGIDAVELAAAPLAAGFAVDAGDCLGALAPGESCAVGVEFTPPAARSGLARLDFELNGEAPQPAMLAGSGPIATRPGPPVTGPGEPPPSPPGADPSQAPNTAPAAPVAATPAPCCPARPRPCRPKSSKRGRKMHAPKKNRQARRHGHRRAHPGAGHRGAGPGSRAGRHLSPRPELRRHLAELGDARERPGPARGQRGRAGGKPRRHPALPGRSKQCQGRDVRR